MLQGINPLLSGELLWRLDQMGHGDWIVIADAHFPAHRFGVPVLEVASTTPDLLEAVLQVIPADTYQGPAVQVMQPEDGFHAPVIEVLHTTSGVGQDRFAQVERFDFYDQASRAFVIVRTLETRQYANVMLRKGVVGL